MRVEVAGGEVSHRTSARRSSSVSSALSPSSLRSRVIDSLLRLAARKYVDSRSPPSGCTNGGPQPRVSSPAPGLSTLITRAPRSPSIIAACGPASARVRSTTTRPASGPSGGVIRRMLRPQRYESRDGAEQQDADADAEGGPLASHPGPVVPRQRPIAGPGVVVPGSVDHVVHFAHEALRRSPTSPLSASCAVAL